MTTWFTSDWHFGHRNILHLGEGRPFATIEEHDEALIARYNALVRPSDDVWVLGDVAMGDITESLARCARMNGHKILVCGNHDRPAMTDDPVKRARWVERYESEGGFDPVFAQSVCATLIGGTSVKLSHYPYAGDSRDGADRYPERRPIDEGHWLLHGHVHHAWQVNGRQVNVGVDVWGYEPVSIEHLVEFIRHQGAYDSTPCAAAT